MAGAYGRKEEHDGKTCREEIIAAGDILGWWSAGDRGETWVDGAGGNGETWIDGMMVVGPGEAGIDAGKEEPSVDQEERKLLVEKWYTADHIYGGENPALIFVLGGSIHEISFWREAFTDEVSMNSSLKIK